MDNVYVNFPQLESIMEELGKVKDYVLLQTTSKSSRSKPDDEMRLWEDGWKLRYFDAKYYVSGATYNRRTTKYSNVYRRHVLTSAVLLSRLFISELLSISLSSLFIRS